MKHSPAIRYAYNQTWRWSVVLNSTLVAIGGLSYIALHKSTHTLDELVIVRDWSPLFIIYFLFATWLSSLSIVKSNGWPRVGNGILTGLNVIFLGITSLIFYILLAHG